MVNKSDKLFERRSRIIFTFNFNITIDISEEINSFILSLITGSVGHSQSSDNKNSGLFIQGRNFLRFFGAINQVPTYEGFRFMGT